MTVKIMTVEIAARRIAAAALLGVLAAGPCLAQGEGYPAPTPTEKSAPPIPAPSATPDHGPGASGKGDGSGMGQDTSETGTPKGPGDKGGPPADKTTAPKICDDGRQPIDGACPS